MSRKCTRWLAILLLAGPLPNALAETPTTAENALQRLLQQPRLGCAAQEPDAAMRAALQALYQMQHFAPLWDATRLAALRQQLDALADDGLDPGHYHRQALARPDDLAPTCREALASHAYLLALQHLRHGRLAAQAREALWHAQSTPPPVASVLAPDVALRGLDDLPATFEQARPAAAQYRELRRVYAAQRRQPLPSWTSLPAGALLRPERRDPRVPALAQRLAAEGYLSAAEAAAADEHYGAALVAALRRFQQRHHVQADGVLGPATLAELNVPAQTRRDQLRVNLERWRWLAGELEPNLLLVDIAGAELSYYRDDALQWQSRTQVGRAERPTPQLKSRISHLTLNPTWTVPPTILKQDKLPEIRRDLGYLQRNHLRVLDYAGNELDPQGIDWNNPGAVLLRQDPGRHNALGRVAIRFPNPFAVYLHDTPSQYLFDKLPRVFSSGCVRVEGALRLMDLLLDGATPARRARIDAWFASGETRNVDLPRPLPILMAYWTVATDAEGALYRPDLYRLDAPLLAALERAGAH
ncbi:Murein L,D-transpeptidase YcbB/YkuD [Geopseudomonas guangdongensis]|uniref:Murein L,D-transpeptidase YcbB/YkuD n=1 Tax=Geopseudomonas guangdongensis TaxID=1245526 RepID=A0A1H2GZ88_9GAMM|nr:Murein L,D-transpeptidase YcbB/YkuD [Pseudomonas guangdongensis]